MSIQQRSRGVTLPEVIAELDVDAVGIASLSELKGTKIEEAARKLLPEASSVVVFAMEVYPEILNLSSPGRMMGAASLNDMLGRHTEYLAGRLTKAAYDVARVSRNIGQKALPLPAAGCPTDGRLLEAVFSYKHAGQAVGLGKIGWHSLLVTPGFGPRVRLSCCLTEAPLEATNSNGSFDVECAECGICLDKCPAGALVKPGAVEQYDLNKFACCSFVNASGGCAECMRVCPVAK